MLVRCRAGVLLPLELELSLGMRKYFILFMEERGSLLVYQRDLGHFALVDKVTKAVEGLKAVSRA